MLSWTKPTPSMRSPLKSALRGYCRRVQASTNARAGRDGFLMSQTVIGPFWPRHASAPRTLC